MQSVFSVNKEISAALDKFVLDLITPAVKKIGWEFPEGEDLLTGRLRALLISTAGNVGHQA